MLPCANHLRSSDNEDIDSVLCLLQRIWEGIYLGRPTIIKQRFSKKYRHALLDSKLTLSRLKQVNVAPSKPSSCQCYILITTFPLLTRKSSFRQEVRSILKARKLGVATPVLYFVEHEASSVYMERVQGGSLKEALHDSALTGEGEPRLLIVTGKIVSTWLDTALGCTLSTYDSSSIPYAGRDAIISCRNPETWAHDTAVSLWRVAT